MNDPATTNVSDPRLTNKFGVKKGKNVSERNIGKNRLLQQIMVRTENSVDVNSACTLVIREIVDQLTQSSIGHLPHWKLLTDKTKTILYHLALRSMAEEQGMIAVPFTLNLTNDIIKQLEHNEAETVKKLNHNIRQRLKRATGRNVQHYLTFEVEASGTKDDGRPHIHGTILLTEKEAKTRNKNPIRQALHAINKYSDKPDFKKFALRVKKINADTNWGSYSTKQTGKNSIYLPETKPVYCSQEVTRQAKKLWSEIRDQVNNPLSDRQPEKAPEQAQRLPYSVKDKVIESWQEGLREARRLQQKRSEPLFSKEDIEEMDKAFEQRFKPTKEPAVNNTTSELSDKDVDEVIDQLEHEELQASDVNEFGLYS